VPFPAALRSAEQPVAEAPATEGGDA
jgi:hypothetical protein